MSKITSPDSHETLAILRWYARVTDNEDVPLSDPEHQINYPNQIIKIENYITGGPGYAETLFIVVWDSGPAFTETFYLNSEKVCVSCQKSEHFCESAQRRRPASFQHEFKPRYINLIDRLQRAEPGDR